MDGGSNPGNGVRNRGEFYVNCWCDFLGFAIIIIILAVKVKFSRYRPGVAQRVGRGIALLFHDRGTRRR